jgi:hypothetical protein
MFPKNQYSEKLRDPRWQKKRLKILERDGFTCQDCGDKDSPLHVHHVYYVKGREPWDYPQFSLRTLCEECHSLTGGTYDSENMHVIDEWESAIEFLSDGEFNNFSAALWDIGVEVARARERGIDYRTVASAMLHAVSSL